MRRRSLLALPFLGPASRARAQPAPLRVVASFSILGYMLREVGGARIALRVLAGPDVDAHGFQPRPSHAEALRGAQLVLRNGLGFESWFDRLLRSAGGAPRIVTVTDGLAIRPAGQRAPGEAPRPGSPAPDPHAWQDLRLGQGYARAIGAALAAADPPGAAEYAARTTAYVARLGTLDGWVREQIGRVPSERRKVVTTHDSFGYFADAYGVTFLAAQGVSPESEPSAAAVARLVRLIRAEGITAVFQENAGNPATLRRITAEAGVTLRGRLYADALSAPGGPAATYEAMFRHNVGLLVPAMLGAPT